MNQDENAESRSLPEPASEASGEAGPLASKPAYHILSWLRTCPSVYANPICPPAE
jgi:hypothetical protein